MLHHTLTRLGYGEGVLSDVPITAGIGTAIGTDVIAGSHYQMVKLIHGSAGVNSGLISSINGLPVTGSTQNTNPVYTIPGFKLVEQYTRAVLSFSTINDNIAVAAVASQFVRVYALLFTVDTPVSVKFGDTTPAYVSGAMKFVTGGGLWLPAYGEPYFTTAVGKGFVINLSAAVQCSGIVWYQQGI